MRSQKDLTPESFLRSFAEFKFELGERVQDAETFLQRKRGDCDDFATLAADLLTQRGYKTKIVVVMMPRETHVVCYVKEAGGFLDFNHRADAHPVIPSDGTLEDVASKVAAYFRSHWTMASEVRYEKARPIYVDNVFPLAQPATVAAAPAPVRSEVVAVETPATAEPAKESQKTSAPVSEANAPTIVN